MGEIADPLAALRDIHLPPGPPWWPLAPGWWWLIGIGTGIGGALLVWRYWYRWRYRRAALRAIAQVKKDYRSGMPDRLLVARLSYLLRRNAMRCYPDEPIAGLPGDHWLQFLDQTSHTKEFSHGPGRCLATAIYQPQPDVDGHRLIALAETWVKKNL